MGFDVSERNPGTFGRQSRSIRMGLKWMEIKHPSQYYSSKTEYKWDCKTLSSPNDILLEGVVQKKMHITNNSIKKSKTLFPKLNAVSISK